MIKQGECALEYNGNYVRFLVGTEIKNYKEMCKLLGEEIKGGKGKKFQMDNWKRYFNFEKQGQKFIITEIYDTPFPTVEAQRKREGLYVQYIECLLMDLIITSTNKSASGKRQLVIPKNKLYEMLGMVNERYSRFYGKERTLIGLIEEIENVGAETDDSKFDLSYYDVDEFYKMSGSRLNNILKTALKSMRNRRLIDYERSYVIVYNDNNTDLDLSNIFDDYVEEGTRKLVNIDEREKIVNIERQALLSLGYKNIQDVFRNNSYKSYQKAIKEILAEQYPEWKFFYPVFYLVHSDDFENQLPLKAEEVRKLTMEQRRLELNSKICDSLERSVDNKYVKNQKQLQDYYNVPDGWGDPNPMEKPFVLEGDYTIKQKKLIDYTIKLDEKKENVDTEQINR